MSAQTVTEPEYRAGIDEMFKALDLDRNYALDWNECHDMVKAVMKSDGGYDAASFREKYDSMDANDDGKISKQEFIEAVVAIGRERGLFGNGKKQESQFDRPMANFAVAIDDNEEAVDVQLFRDGLSCLGKTFNNARHAYLKMNICEKGLSTLKGVGRYKYLQYVDVSGNMLTTL